MNEFVNLRGCSIPIRSNQDNDNSDKKILLLINIKEEAYNKLIRKSVLEGLDQSELVNRLIMLLDDKHRMED